MQEQVWSGIALTFFGFILGEIAARRRRKHQERHTRFVHLQERRFDLLRELYARLAKASDLLHQVVKLYTYPHDPPLQERIDNFVVASKEAGWAFRDYRPFLPRKVCEAIEEYQSEAFRAGQTFSQSRRTERFDKEKSENQWVEAYQRVGTKAQPAIQKLEDHIRNLFAVDGKPD